PGAQHHHQVVGRLGRASQQLAAGLARPGAFRRTVQTPSALRPGNDAAGTVAPPPWWTPEARQARRRGRSPVEPATHAPTSPPRGLPRAVRRGPNQETRTPGGIVSSLVSHVARVRRLQEVIAAGQLAEPPRLSSAAIRRQLAASDAPKHPSGVTVSPSAHRA